MSRRQMSGSEMERERFGPVMQKHDDVAAILAKVAASTERARTERARRVAAYADGVRFEVTEELNPGDDARGFVAWSVDADGDASGFGWRATRAEAEADIAEEQQRIARAHERNRKVADGLGWRKDR
jgi:hypothetical protein